MLRDVGLHAADEVPGLRVGDVFLPHTASPPETDFHLISSRQMKQADGY